MRLLRLMARVVMFLYLSFLLASAPLPLPFPLVLALAFRAFERVSYFKHSSARPVASDRIAPKILRASAGAGGV